MQNLKKETNSENNWYVVRTIPRHEKIVCKYFDSREIEYYCPKKIQERQWSDRKKMVEVILIPTYIFVYLKENQKKIVLDHPSVLHFLNFGKKPAVVKSKDIQTLKRFLNDHDEYEVIEDQSLEQGSEVEIKNGVFIGMKGLINSLQGKIAYITLPLINKILKFKIPITNLTKIK